MNPNNPFDRVNLSAAETLLTEHEIAREFFQGELYQGDGVSRLGGIEIRQPGGATLDLDESQTGKLFMIPDGSMVWALILREQAEAPSGLDIMSNSPFMDEDKNTSVIAYRDDHGTSLHVDTLYIRRLMLTGEAPERLATVAFALMAISACRLGFRHISSSGEVSRHRLNRGGDRAANSALHIIAIGRIRTAPRTKEYVAKRLNEGHSKMEAIRCLKRYIAREVFQIIRKRHNEINSVQIAT